MSQDLSNHSSTRDLAGGSSPDARGLVTALELMELGIELARQRIARENPGISDAELAAKVNEWLAAPRGQDR